MRKMAFLLAFGLVAWAPAVFGQTPAVRVDNEFVHQQFGQEFTLLPQAGVVFGDLDGDGVEDAVIAARCKNPLLDESEHNYKVLDPYMTFYGFGDPKVTTTFGKGDPRWEGLVVLIIHGAGPDAWHSATPKAKFVVINLPYKQITVRKFAMWNKQKKQLMAVFVEEGNDENETSALYFDGKKYKYTPMGASMQ